MPFVSFDFVPIINRSVIKSELDEFSNFVFRALFVRSDPFQVHVEFSAQETHLNKL